MDINCNIKLNNIKLYNICFIKYFFLYLIIKIILFFARVRIRVSRSMCFDLMQLMPDDDEILWQEIKPDRPSSVDLRCIALRSRVTRCDTMDPLH